MTILTQRRRERRVPAENYRPAGSFASCRFIYFFVPQKSQKSQKFFILLGNLFTIRMAWGVAPFCYFRYFCGTIIHYLRDIKTISARPLRSLRLCVRIVMPHGFL